MQIKLKLLFWYLLIQILILASFNYALFLNVEHNLHDTMPSTIHAHEAIEHFLTRMWILDPFILMLSSLGGYLLVRQYFKPIHNMLQEIRAITPKDLSLRIKQRPFNDEINHLASAFNEMLDRLEKGFLGVKEFNTNASHELRTPLTIMRGEIEIALRKERSKEEYTRILHIQLEEIKTLQKRIEELLFLAEYNAMDASHALKSFSAHEQHALDIQKASCLHASQG